MVASRQSCVLSPRLRDRHLPFRQAGEIYVPYRVRMYLKEQAAADLDEPFKKKLDIALSSGSSRAVSKRITSAVRPSHADSSSAHMFGFEVDRVWVSGALVGRINQGVQ